MRAAESNAISIGLAPHAHRPLESGPRAAPLTNAGSDQSGRGKLRLVVVGALVVGVSVFDLGGLPRTAAKLRMRAAVVFAVFTGCYRVAAQTCAEKNVMQTKSRATDALTPQHNACRQVAQIYTKLLLMET